VHVVVGYSLRRKDTSKKYRIRYNTSRLNRFDMKCIQNSVLTFSQNHLTMPVNLRVLLVAMLLATGLCAQEFTIHPNGLIYSDTTIRQLGLIVDSLNLRFKTCDLSKPYYGRMQAKGFYYNLDSLAQPAKADLEHGISQEDFHLKYGFDKASIPKLLVLMVEKANEEHPTKPKVYFELYPGDDGFHPPFDPGFRNNFRKGKWLYGFYPKDEYSDKDRLEAVFLITDVTQRQKPALRF
jgi:hypothetical protein